jgi:hypothetical protein
MTHFLCIGEETRNEGGFLDKKTRIIGKCEDFSDGDWKRREFRQTSSTHACVLECSGNPECFRGTPLSNGAGFRKRNLSLRRQVLIQKRCHRHRTPGPFGDTSGFMESRYTFFAHRGCKRETNEKLAEKCGFTEKFEASARRAAKQKNVHVHMASAIQSTIVNLQFRHGALNR